MPSVMLSVINHVFYAACRYAVCHGAQGLSTPMCKVFPSNIIRKKINEQFAKKNFSAEKS